MSRQMLILLLFSTTFAIREVPPEKVNAEFQACITWFDGLGFADVAKGKFVKVATGWGNAEPGKEAKNDYLHAFLLTDDAESFTTLMPDLVKRRFQKTKGDVPAHKVVSWEDADLQKFCTELLQPEPEQRNGFPRGFGRLLPVRTERFVLARACAGRGWDELAQRLFAQAKAMPHKQTRRADETGKAFLLRLSADVAHAATWRGVDDFGNTSISRTELLERFQWLVKHFPDNEHALKEPVDLLTQMVAEDEAHARLRKPPVQELPVQERVAELIFQLRDQNGHQIMQPGHCDVFAMGFGEEKKENSPAHQLVEIGLDAVPSLIEALDDRRFLCSVGFHRDFHFSHYVLRVGDCAEAILSRIACRPFWESRSTFSYLTMDGDVADARQRVRAWWDEVQKKGEKQVLIEGTELGDRSSPKCAERLVKYYPDVALECVRKALGRTEDGEIHELLVQETRPLEGGAVVAFLLEQLRSSSLDAQVSAAQQLKERGHYDGVQVMTEVWTELKTSSEEERFYGPETRLIALLLWSGDPVAVDALSSKWSETKRAHRDRILGELQNEFNKGDFKPTPAWNQAVDALLAKALTDLERTNSGGSWDDKPFRCVRIADFSAHLLAKRWQMPAAFDLSGPLAVRDRLRLELLNTWRKRQGESPLSIPAAPVRERLGAEQMGPRLRAILDAATPSERTKSVEEVFALGLPALPAVQEQLRSLDANHPAQPAMRDLAVCLGFVVREVRFEEKSVPPSPAYRKKAETLVTKSLTPTRLAELVRAVVSDLPKGATGISLRVDRRADDGVVLAITLTEKHARQHGSQRVWVVSSDGGRGPQTFALVGGSYSLEYVQSEKFWQKFVDEFRDLFAVLPDQDVELEFSMIQQGE